MPTILAVAVGAAPVTWTVCGLRLLARRGSIAATEVGAADRPGESRDASAGGPRASSPAVAPA